MKKRILIFSIISILVGCSHLTSDTANGNLPKNPKLIKIRWNKDGGMLPEYERIYLSNDSCSYLTSKEGIDQLVEFSIEHQQLTELYQVFYDNEFNKIETFTEEIYDRGGSSISLSVDTQSFSISNSGMTLIKKENAEQYATIEEAILKTTFDEINKQKRIVTVDLDTSITNSQNDVVLYVNGDTEYSEKNNGEFFTLELSLLPTNNAFQIYFMKDGNNSYQTVVEHYVVVLEKLPENSKILLTLENDQLIIK